MSMVSERADEAAAGADVTVMGIEKDRCSDEANGNASGLTAIGALFVEPVPSPTFDDDDDCPDEVNESEAEEAPAPAPAVAVSGRRSCHASDGVRSISDDRTPERVRVVKVGGSDEKPARADDDDDDGEDENENAELFAALFRGVDDRV